MKRQELRTITLCCYYFIMMISISYGSSNPPTILKTTNVSSFKISSGNPNIIIIGYPKGIIRTWNLITHKMINEKILTNSNNFLYDVVMINNEHIIICFTDTNIIKLNTKLQVMEYYDQINKEIEYYDQIKEYNTKMVVTDDSDIIIFGSRSVQMWQKKNTNIINNNEKKAGFFNIKWKRNYNMITSNIISSNEYIIFGYYDGSIGIWNTKNGDEIDRLNGHTDLVVSICITKDNKRIISGSNNGYIIVWDIKNNRTTKKRQQFQAYNNEGLTSISVNNDNILITNTENEEMKIYVWIFNNSNKYQYKTEPIDIILHKRNLYSKSIITNNNLIITHDIIKGNIQILTSKKLNCNKNTIFYLQKLLVHKLKYITY